MNRRFFFALLLLTACATAWGQRCGFTDTIAIGSIGETDVTISIEDYLNNDLSNPGQGLCGISLYFQHSYVYDLTVTVTSPAGQSVEFIGPLNAQTRPSTILARWFVDFLACDSTAAPDPGATGQWNNNSAFDWPAVGLFRGDYFPATGCFSDLNTGPVNGDWTITFSNSRTGQEQDRATYLLLTFCDDRNEQGPCCFANAGELEVEPVIEACEFSADVPLDYPPRYRQPRPDAAIYGYTYAIARNDSVLFTQDNVNLAGLPAGEYEICGLSYKLGELPLLPLSGSFGFDQLREDFAAVQPTLCADLTPECQRVRLVPIPDTVFLSRTVCIGGSVSIGPETYDATGTFPTTLVGRAGCDSVVVLDLEIVDVLREIVVTTICAEAVYLQGGNVYVDPGTYVDTLTSFLDCDSIVTLNLLFAEPILFDTTLSICAGDTFFVGNEPFFASINDSRRITAVNGCDSVVRFSLLVLEPEVRFVTEPPGLTCDFPELMLDARASNLAFAQSFRWLDTVGNRLASGLVLDVDTAGIYIFEFTAGRNNVTCVDRDTLVIPDLRLDISADLALTQVQCVGTGEQCAVITCRDPSLGILATPTPVGPGYAFQWAAPAGGNIVGADDGAAVVVDAPGRYELMITDPVTGCRFDTFYVIGLDTLQPTAALFGNELLNCERSSLELVADTFQLRRDELAFVWTGDCLPGPVTGPLLSLDCPGNITLTVTNLTNGCSRDTTFLVEEDLAVPVLSLAPATAPINCYLPTQTLDASGSSSTNGLLYAWTINGGPDTIGRNATLDITAPGNYALMITDPRSRCEASESILISGDTLRPSAFTGPPSLTLNCVLLDTVLGDPALSNRPEVSYAWVELSNLDDTLGRTSTLVVAPPGGVFRLTAFDPVNGCRAADSTLIRVALDTPFIRLAQPLDFDCFIDSVLLDASATSLNFPNEQRWSGGCLPTATDANQAQAYCPGTYVYSVLNLESGCAATDSVTVTLANNSVVAILPDTIFLDCNSGETFIDRSAGTDAPVVRWFRDGTPVNLVGQRPRVTVPGVYTLVLGNFNESCLDTARTVVLPSCPVFSVIIPPDSITCDRSFVVLDANASVPAPGAGLVVEWLIPQDAVMLTDPDPRRIQVFTPGVFGFAIRNLIDGSTDTSYVNVVRNQVDPISDAGPRDTITCYRPTVELDGTGSDQGPLLDYVWTNTNGDTIGLTQIVSVSVAGAYLLEVTQRETGCDATNNVFIRRDTDVPDLAFSPAEIPCDTIDFSLAVAPDDTGDYSFAWSGPSILGQGDQDTVRISDAGTYEVTVTNLGNGCPVAGAVVASRLPCPPFPALSDTSLTCKSDTLQLVATFRDPCINCTYRWTRNGSPINGQRDSILPVTRVGTYGVIAVNGFGLDGTASATVTDTRVLPAANAGPDQTLTCAITSHLLGAEDPEPPFSYTYQWIGPDNAAIIGATEDSLRISSGGLYQLVTTNTFSECIALDTVLVNYDTLRPIADAGTGRLLDCNNKRRTLDGIRSSLGRRYTYSWRGGGSELCLEGSTTLNPIIRCGGEYVLTVRDTINGCENEGVTFVDVDDELPNLIPLADTTVTCASDTIQLIGRDISMGNLTFGWEEVLNSGNVSVSEVDPGVISVIGAGTFRFSATNLTSGCDNEFTVNVSTDLVRPVAEAGLPDTFYCALDSLPLFGTGSSASGRTLTYNWNSQTGFFIGQSDSLTSTIFQPDTYFFSVTDPANFCRTTDSVTIFRDVEAPVAFAGGDTTLSCNRQSLQLVGGGTTLSGQAEYLWTTRDGSILSGNQSLNPIIVADGRYQLNITDPVNDCSGADIVRVTQDTVPPIARVDLLDGDLLNCFRPVLGLSGNRSVGFGASLAYRWNGPVGFTANGREINVEASGRYLLTAVSNRNSCQDTLSVVLREDFVAPSSAITDALPLTCSRDSVILAPVNIVPGFRYRWLNASGDPIIIDEQLRVGAMGNYLLETVDQGNGCRDTTTTFVGEDRTPPTVTLADPLVLNCFRSFATIDGTGSSRGQDFERSWASPGNTAVASADPYQVRGSVAGFYYLTVNNRVNGCQTVDSVELLRSALAVDDIDLEITQPACSADPNGELMIMGVSGGTPPFRYRLDNGLLTDRLVYEGLPIGRYQVEVVGGDGCSTTKTFEIDPGPEVSVDLRNDTLIRLGDSLPLNFVTNILNWDTLIWTSSGPLPRLQSNGPLTVRPLLSQGYRLVVVGADGCSATDEVVIEIDGTVDVFVPTAFSPNEDGTNDKIRPYFGPQVSELLSFRIFDRWGEQLYDLDEDSDRGSDFFGWDGNLDGKPLNPQVFIWQLAVELVDGTIILESGDFVLLR